MILLAILSGSTLGVFSGLLGRSFVLLLQGDKNSFYMIFAVLVSIIWLLETSHYSVSNGLWKASASTLTILAVSLAIVKIGVIKIFEFLPLFLSFNLVFLALSAFISFTASLSFALFFSLFGNRHQHFRKMTIIMIIIILSVVVAYFFNQSPSNNGVLTLDDFAITKMLAGMIFGFVFVKASYKVTNFSHKVNPNFLFLKKWAITLSTWGSTSFYNLDLSSIDFTSAIVTNTDLRANKFYRTCLRNVKGLDRARVDNRYIDLDNPKVQKLLIEGCSNNTDFSYLNLQGACLRDDAILRDFNFTNTNLNGADLSGADLRDAILVRAQCVDVDFTDANLTGICIQDWSVNNQTCFTNVQCDYIYRKLNDKGKPCDRYPLDRNFEPREFESLYQEVGNVVELVFKEGLNWRAFAFTLQKLQIEDDGLGLELKGIEKRGDLWVVKVIHNENVSNHEVEKRLNSSYEQLQKLLASKEQQINQLLGIAGNQAETIKEFSKRPFGNSFSITGSTITNLAGSGQIEYDEAAEQVRSIVANSSNPVEITTSVRNMRTQLQGQKVATTALTQAELIKQVLLSEAEKDDIFKHLLILQGQQLPDAMLDGVFATAIQEAVAQLG